MEKSNVIYFFHEEDFLSQWHCSSFRIDDIEFSCCEQWMMYSKAMLFNDCESAKRILKEQSPGKQKEIGRQVKGFKNQVWNDKREDIVFTGNLAKFSQNEGLKEKLFETGSSILAEANPNDPIWGIGLSEAEARKKYISEWRGKNLLGKILMQVRSELGRDRAGLFSRKD